MKDDVTVRESVQRVLELDGKATKGPVVWWQSSTTEEPRRVYWSHAVAALTDAIRAADATVGEGT